MRTELKWGKLGGQHAGEGEEKFSPLARGVDKTMM